MGFFQDVKREVSLSSVVSEYTSLSSVGRGKFRGCCPIHGGDNPSGFAVDDDKGMWHCFSGDCGGGSVIDFAIKIGMASDAFEAASVLAKSRGIEVPEDTQGVSDESRIRAVELVCKEAHRQLRDSAVAREYLEGRAINGDMVDEWLLGFISDEGSVVSLLRKEGLSAAAEDVGLLVRSFGRTGIRCAKRLVMPVRYGGHYVGWSARVVDGVSPSYASEAKYLNSRDSGVYRKREMVFGEQFLHEGVSTVLFVEGNVDAIMVNEGLYRAGLDGECACVAVCGSTLTEGQLRRVLDRSPRVNRVVLAFDNDSGGIGAFKGAFWLVGEPGVEVVVAGGVGDSLGSGKRDQADVISELLLSDVGGRALGDYMDMLVDGGSYCDFIASVLAGEDEESAVSWVRGVWGFLSREGRERFVDSVDARVDYDFRAAVGSYVPRSVLRSSKDFTGFVVPAARELLELPYDVRCMVLRRLVGDGDFQSALSLSRRDVDFLVSLSEVSVVGSGTSDVAVAEFFARFGGAGEGEWVVVPAVCRWVLSRWGVGEYKVEDVRRVANMRSVGDGAAAWVWLCGLFGV